MRTGSRRCSTTWVAALLLNLQKKRAIFFFFPSRQHCRAAAWLEPKIDESLTWKTPEKKKEACLSHFRLGGRIERTLVSEVVVG